MENGALTAHVLDSLYGGCTRSGNLPWTVRNIQRVIAAALNQGARWEWLDQNPAERAKLPKAIRQ